jgi:hypothetical protein
LFVTCIGIDTAVVTSGQRIPLDTLEPTLIRTELFGDTYRLNRTGSASVIYDIAYHEKENQVYFLSQAAAYVNNTSYCNITFVRTNLDGSNMQMVLEVANYIGGIDGSLEYFAITQSTEHPIIYYIWNDTLFSFDTATQEQILIPYPELDFNYTIEYFISYNDDLWFIINRETGEYSTSYGWALVSYNLENNTFIVWLELNDTNYRIENYFAISGSIYYSLNDNTVRKMEGNRCYSIEYLYT